MNLKEDIVMSWSGGKDSSFALFQLLNEGKYNVKYLLTNIYKPNKRVSMHGVPESLIEMQAKSIGIPLIKLYIEEKTHDEYELKMKELLLSFKDKGINKVAFGDIFLEDLKKYRETKLAEVNMEALFPLWMENTYELAFKFIKLEFKTHICSIDTSKVPNDLIGIDYSESFINKLPIDVDPCGENGEFHSFCYDGPIFKSKIIFKKNKIVEKKYTHNKQDYHYLFSDIS
ncbi:MAG: diphthine--ammonia ligase [Flavobacteriales bacterium]|nr:diphthine--ammonia ligase [Flavobacteriales bacterium]